MSNNNYETVSIEIEDFYTQYPTAHAAFMTLCDDVVTEDNYPFIESVVVGFSRESGGRDALVVPTSFHKVIWSDGSSTRLSAE